MRNRTCLLLTLASLALVDVPALAQAVYTPYTFTTLAGNAGWGSGDGTGSAARFYSPSAVAVDGAGNVFVADTDNYTIRKITPAGEVTTLAGSARTWGTTDGTGSAARFSGPNGVAADSAGNVFVADNCTIRKVTSAGVVTTLAGTPGAYGTDDGTGAEARFSGPTGVAADSAGNVFVADNCTIRKVTSAGVVTTLAGSPGVCGTNDGTGAEARFSSPSGVAVDSAGNLYATDGGSMIRKITPTGVVTTLAGSPGTSGTNDGMGAEARFSSPSGVAVDSAGNLFVADVGNNTIRKVTSTGAVTTLAGDASFRDQYGQGGYRDGTGSAALFYLPSSVAVDSAGNVFVADTRNHNIRKVTSAGVVTTLAGGARRDSYTAADGPASAARFTYPWGVAVDSAGNVFVAGDGVYEHAGTDYTIRKVTSTGVVTTLAGSPGLLGTNDGTGSDARFNSPQGVAVDRVGNLFVADSENSTIRKVTSAGVVTTLAGSPGAQGTNDGSGTEARFRFPSGVAVDSAGNLFVTDFYNNTIRKVTLTGAVTTLAGDPSAWPPGSADGTGSAARFFNPSGVAVDSAGNIFVADSGNNTIRKVTPDGIVTTLAGSPEDRNGDGWPDGGETADGIGSAARFWRPEGVAVDRAGNVFVADAQNNTIRKVTAAGVVTTVAGNTSITGPYGSHEGGCADGTGSTAQFRQPCGLAVDSAGNLFVADTDNSTIRKGWPASAGVGVTITVPPQSLVTNAGATVTFSVAATGTGQLSYQWRFNGGNIPGATNPTLTLNSVGAANSGAHSVAVGNAINTVVSAAASLAVLADGANWIQPLQITVPPAPVQSGKDSLVVVTHGFQLISLFGSPQMPPWVTHLCNSIRARVPANWGVTSLDWSSDAYQPDPDLALIRGVVVGSRYGQELLSGTWQHVHLIGHSAGAAVIEAIAHTLASSTTPPVIHETFLDPYTEFITVAGQQVYGANADWSDSYFVNDWTGRSTGGGLGAAFNVDVSWVDPDHTETPFPCPSSTAGSTPPILDNVCGYRAWSSHSYPVDFYSNSVANTLPSCAAAYGFRLSQEGGGWASRGSYPPNGANPLVLCGPLSTAQNPFPVNTGLPFQLNLLPSATSSSGVSFTGVGGATLSVVSSQSPQSGPRPMDVSTNAPAWLALGVTVTNTINFIRFDSGFTDTKGSQGLLTVYWNTNQIGLIDERAATPGLQTYRFALPAPVSAGLYTLSFRLDAFTSTESAIIITNVATGFVGITQPITLEMLFMGSNNTPVLKLTAAPGYNYLVQNSTNLVDWLPTALLANTNGAVLFADPGVTNRGGRFYRAMMQ